ncbi:ATPase [Luteitalea sp. TBR-22]|uniref:chemotaxis protein CheW n=1 Tax=Luteitalea sp. TBR-22 TaxID=2802971 RepID=UPI001AF46C61|nr:chemotaxis protein CheW [Luteitalea sp. TBR-22]BCS33483.1 ATPase [Luteitalea sp. TBR-22]
MSESDDLIREFLIESHEGLDRLDQDLVELEKDPRNRETLGSVFRAIHTIKGTCGFLGFTKLEGVSHVGESLLSRLRDGDMVLDADITTGLLGMVDAIREILAAIESTGAEGDADYTAVIQRLQELNEQKGQAARTVAAPAAPPVAAPAVVEVPSAAAPAAPAPPPPAPVAEAVVAHAEDAEPVTTDDRKGAVSDSSLRVDVGLVDKLMNLVGELVLARNQILQFTTTQNDASFVNATQRLNLVTSELQEGVMKTRMQPIGNVWSKFPRVVRDLASMCGKQVRIEMEGKETDLDRTIIEAIKDPLTHIIRNSVDHGIESPADRIARGKRAEGTIRLRAFHEGGQINIEISDDGAGIAAEKVRQRALQRGLVTTDQSQRLSDHDVIKLIFLPGFSTAEKITNVSGRGVGMDVVKTNIEKIGGTVDIQSVAGSGTTLKIKIPLTLAIIPALMVSSGGERFAIPQVSLLELVRLEGMQASSGIERIGKALFYRLRGNLLPLVHLHSALRLDPVNTTDDAVNIVVLKADQRQFGLVVETVHDTEEIVVKPLGKQLKGLTAFAGATIMGDGRVALILDVLGLGQMAQVVSETRSSGNAAAASSEAAASTSEDTRTLLVFQASERDRMALPLSLVARLEEFPRSLLEQSGDRTVVQYRGEILPLVSLARYFHRPEAQVDPLQVIVFSFHDQHVGLIVERIVDIVQQVVVVDQRHRRRGIIGSTVLQQQVTDLLDADAVIADAGLFEAAVA